MEKASIQGEGSLSAGRCGSVLYLALSAGAVFFCGFWYTDLSLAFFFT